MLALLSTPNSHDVAPPPRPCPEGSVMTWLHIINVLPWSAALILLVLALWRPVVAFYDPWGEHDVQA